jgi:hypothetical protein
MTTDALRAIVTGRLADWTEVLVANHCTPMVLIAVGHDHEGGNIHVCYPDESLGVLTAADLAKLLRRVAHDLDPAGPAPAAPAGVRVELADGGTFRVVLDGVDQARASAAVAALRGALGGKAAGPPGGVT